MAAAAQYDIFADTYTKSTISSLYNAYIERPAMVKLIGDPKGLDILDLGCGTIVLGAALLQAGANSLTGIDSSREMLRIAATRTPKDWTDRVLLIQHDLNEPFHIHPGRKYDLIVSSLALHYLAGWTPALTSALAHLKPSGRFILSVHHPFGDWLNHPEVGSYHGGPTLITEQWDSIGGNQIHFYRRSLAMMSTEIADAGWAIERIVEPSPIEEAKEVFGKEKWERVSRKPSFLIFVLVKAAANLWYP